MSDNIATYKGKTYTILFDVDNQDHMGPMCSGCDLNTEDGCQTGDFKGDEPIGEDGEQVLCYVSDCVFKEVES